MVRVTLPSETPFFRIRRVFNRTATTVVQHVRLVTAAGHGGPGTVQDHHDSVLQRRHGVHSHVRHHQRGVVQQRTRLVSAVITCYQRADRVRVAMNSGRETFPTPYSADHHGAARFPRWTLRPKRREQPCTNRK